MGTLRSNIGMSTYCPGPGMTNDAATAKAVCLPEVLAGLHGMQQRTRLIVENIDLHVVNGLLDLPARTTRW